jgi:phosphatidylethanolamine/phosphatidyl-N-methylethanolamine N-methyltransferase
MLHARYSITTSSASHLYGRYAGIYDLFFGLSLRRGRSQTIQRMNLHPGQKILELGIGTGLSIPLYPAGVKLTGIDLSSEMLRQAERRVSRSDLQNIQLFQMNAQKLEFGINTFDQCVAMYVASVTPNPVKMVREMKRVTKPGGRLFILNHFSRKNSWLSFFEKTLSSHARHFGFESLFYLDEFLLNAEIEDAAIIPIQPLGYWRLLEIKNKK